MYGLSAIEVLHLNCIAAVPTVFCVCNAWLWGQLSFSDACSITWEVVGSVNSCGRRCFLNVIENVVPRWFCRVSRYIFSTVFTVFWMRRTVLGTAVQSLRSSLIVFLRDAFVFARSCTSEQLCRVQKARRHTKPLTKKKTEPLAKKHRDQRKKNTEFSAKKIQSSAQKKILQKNTKIFARQNTKPIAKNKQTQNPLHKKNENHRKKNTFKKTQKNIEKKKLLAKKTQNLLKNTQNPLKKQLPVEKKASLRNKKSCQKKLAKKKVAKM